eukprot:g7357.t1
MPYMVLPALCDAAQRLDPRARAFAAWAVDRRGDVECHAGDDSGGAAALAAAARASLDAPDAPVPIILMESSANHLLPVPPRDWIAKMVDRSLRDASAHVPNREQVTAEWRELFDNDEYLAAPVSDACTLSSTGKFFKFGMSKKPATGRILRQQIDVTEDMVYAARQFLVLVDRTAAARDEHRLAQLHPRLALDAPARAVGVFQGRLIADSDAWRAAGSSLAKASCGLQLAIAAARVPSAAAAAAAPPLSAIASATPRRNARRATVFGKFLKWLVDEVRPMYGTDAAFGGPRCDDFTRKDVWSLWNRVSCKGEAGAAPGMDGGWTVDLWKQLASARCGKAPRQALATFVRICHAPPPTLSPVQRESLQRVLTAFVMAPVIVFGGLRDTRDSGGCLVPMSGLATRAANRVSSFFAGRWRPWLDALRRDPPARRARGTGVSVERVADLARLGAYARSVLRSSARLIGLIERQPLLLPGLRVPQLSASKWLLRCAVLCVA